MKVLRPALFACVVTAAAPLMAANPVAPLAMNDLLRLASTAPLEYRMAVHAATVIRLYCEPQQQRSETARALRTRLIEWRLDVAMEWIEGHKIPASQYLDAAQAMEWSVDHWIAGFVAHGSNGAKTGRPEMCAGAIKEAEAIVSRD
ncbi:hypothetical protein [Novilysobacter spongiicola]|uniref:hypothetical protein n=1 Tax=Novilysobacter spongiicola TaxID=435289 RepID=UPI00117EADEE|nr:hypothetical protein [Lysobacter spongiicola]